MKKKDKTILAILKLSGFSNKCECGAPLKVIRCRGKIREYYFLECFEDISWRCLIAYDSKRNIAVNVGSLCENETITKKDKMAFIKLYAEN